MFLSQRVEKEKRTWRDRFVKMTYSVPEPELSSSSTGIITVSLYLIYSIWQAHEAAEHTDCLKHA